MMNTRSKTKKKRQEDSDHQSGALVASNDDLLIEILLRLPVTSVLRFKSVSKHWLCLLSHRHFTTQYDNYNNFSKSPAGLFDDSGKLYVPFDVENRCTPRPFRSLNFCRDRSFRILQSCNGLLLCRKGYGDSRIYYLLNPTTKQFAVLPSVPGGQRVRQSIRFMALAFHPTDCPHYKVVCIRTVHAHEAFVVGIQKFLYQVLIYSSDTRKWKVSVESFSVVDPPLLGNGVYWNGSIHWPPRYPIHLYFKLDVEQLQTLPLPPEMMSSDHYSTMYFGESRGHLHLIVYKYGLFLQILNVYEMLSDRLRWFVKYQVDLVVLTRALPGMFRSSYYDFKVVDVVIGEEEEDTFVVLVTLGRMITYNVHDKSFKHIHRVVSCFSTFHRYTNTLTCF